MPEQKCEICRHYEPAPMWKRGWCRNPLLFSETQNHLVGADDLDCNRGMGSYWEAMVEEPVDAEPVARFERTPMNHESTGRFTRPQPRMIAPENPQAQPYGTQHSGSRPVQPPRQQAEAAAPRQQTRRRVTPAVRQPEPPQPGGDYSTPLEPYSWGSYLRRSYPVIAIILLLGVFWIWTARYLAPPTATPTVVAAPVASAVPVAVITPTAVAAAPPPAAAAPPSAPPGVLGPGATVVVKTAGGAGANIREKPSTSAAIVTAVDDGGTLKITGNSQEAGGYTWWPVSGDGFQGWVAGTLIELP